jgi:putative acetyltransferase
MIEIVPAQTVESYRIAAGLFREYAAAIGIDLGFQNFEEELASLPGDYAPPAGRLLLAQDGTEIAGCVAMRALTDGICEMKRLYVRPGFLHRGIGCQLAMRVVEEAWTAGYKAMRLDTLSTMTAATTLYRRLGFVPIPAYRFNPIEGALFFELALRK